VVMKPWILFQRLKHFVNLYFITVLIMCVD
jgi:hypothetical protein